MVTKAGRRRYLRVIRSTAVAYVSIRQHTSAYVSIRQHTSAHVSIRQHTSAYDSIREHTLRIAETSAVSTLQLYIHRESARERERDGGGEGERERKRERCIYVHTPGGIVAENIKVCRYLNSSLPSSAKSSSG
jgi:hypothetical protein